MTRLRLFYGAHLTLFGALLACYALVAAFAPAHWHTAVLVLLLWLPLMLTHTALQTIYEARYRCTTEYQFAPAKASNLQMLPVDLYDEDGNLLRNGEPFTFKLPPPRG